jgi:hypothetical protein
MRFIEPQLRAQIERLKAMIDAGVIDPGSPEGGTFYLIPKI